MAFGVAVIGLIFLSLLGGATDAASHSSAFAWALVTNPMLSLLLVPVLRRGRP
ncbi:hypothetical protein ACFMQL_38070 [Nonomuraea fastidiosa]|uniref:hypothetical protein n=1 Tax=Nonomuraea TaxID=83681 RepID=UPI0032569C1B